MMAWQTLPVKSLGNLAKEIKSKEVDFLRRGYA
jgi:hypothetical protein